MLDYSHWGHWFPTHRGLTASRFTERARCLEIALERHRTWPRPAQMTTDTDPDRQLRTALGRVFDKWASRRRVEARSSLHAALTADDRRTIAALSRRADAALLAQLERGIAAARERAARLARIRPLHRM